MRFVDSSFWIALRFRRDRHFEEARGLWEGYVAEALAFDGVFAAAGFIELRL